MIVSNIQNVSRNITLEDGKTINLNSAVKNVYLDDKYLTDKILLELRKKGSIRIIKLRKENKEKEKPIKLIKKGGKKADE